MSASHKWTVLAAYCATPAPQRDSGPCQQFRSLETSSHRLVYNRTSGNWAFDPHLDPPSQSAWRTDVDINGIHTVYLKRQESVIVVVDDANALRYGVSLGTIEESDISSLEDIKAAVSGVTGLLGVFKSEAFQYAAQREAAPAQQDAVINAVTTLKECREDAIVALQAS